MALTTPERPAESDGVAADAAVLPAKWFKFVVTDGVDCKQPGIYEWKIEAQGGQIYIGKYTRINRPRRAFAVNVAHILGGEPYRKCNPDGFRRIHHALAQAVRNGDTVTLTILENPPRHEINRREQELIAERGTLNGPQMSISKR